MESWLRNKCLPVVLFVIMTGLVLRLAAEWDRMIEEDSYRQGYNRGYSGLEIGDEPNTNRIARRGWRRGWVDGNTAYVNQ